MKNLRNMMAVAMLALSVSAMADDYDSQNASQDVDEASFQMSQGIGDMDTDGQKMRLSGGQLFLQLDNGEKAYIYNMRGEKVYATNRSGVVNIDNMRKGIYIVRVGNVTRKVMTK